MAVPLAADSRRLKRVAVVFAVFFLLLAVGCRRGRKVEPHVYPLEGESRVLPVVVHPAGGPMKSSFPTIAVGGQARSYLLLEPKNEARKELPLVLVFHGDGGDARGLHEAWPWEKASGDDAYVVFPEGIDRTWDLESKILNHDVDFIEALIKDLPARLPIDKTRVFLTGYSSGGFFSNVFACQRSALVRAIASNAGGAPYKQALIWPNGYSRCPSQGKVPMLALHGRMDFGVTIDSGKFSAAYWAYVDGCKEAEQEKTGYDECVLYRGCEKPVGYCEVGRLGHWVWDRSAEVSWTFFQHV